MIKSVDFWEHICNELNYRFFSGIPCDGLDPLYIKMDAKFMHYVPVTDIQTAIGLSNGAFLAGIKSSILLDAMCLYKIDLSFNINNSIPLLIIASSKEKPSLKKDIYNLDLKDNLELCLNKLSKYIENKLKPGILFIEEGILQ